jgi:SAM-dependent methyltransferase
VDLGAGSGFVTTALAPLVASVHAVDISPAMTGALAGRTAGTGLANVSTEVTDLKDFRLPASCADLIVSSYALHHLADADKRALTARAAHWLCPGGRLVIADMMFGRGGNRRGRAILRQKVAALAAKGIGGWWRIAKNLSLQLYRADRAGARYYLDLSGANHLTPYQGTNPVERLTARVTLAFFDRYVLGQPDALQTMTRDGNVTGTAALVSGGHPPP